MTTTDRSLRPTDVAHRADPTADALQRLVDHVPAMVASWGADGRNRAANAAYLEWFGFRPEEMRGIHIKDVLGPKLYAANLAYIEGALDGREQRFARDLVDTAGRVRHTQVTYVPDMAEGSVHGFFVLVAEVTDHVVANEAMRRTVERYRALAHSMPSSFVMLFDQDLRFQLADGRGLELIGLSGDALEGRTVVEVLPGRAEEVVAHYRAALDGVSERWDLVVDGREFSVCTGPVTDDSGTVVAGVAVGTDVTAERHLTLTQAALRRVAIAAAEHATVEEIARLAAGTLLELVGGSHASVVRYEGRTGRVVATLPTHPEQVSTTLDLDGPTACAQVARSGRSSTVRYTAGSTGVGAAIYAAGIRRSVAAPIFVEGDLWGAVAVSLPPRYSSAESIEGLLEHFADVMSIAIGNHRAWTELECQALSDPLTGLPNRRAFDARLASEALRCSRRREPLGVAVVDLDDFKVVNDEHGHGAGDEVLLEVARRLAAAARGDELVARIGGEEFGVVMPACRSADAWGPGERLRRAIGGEAFPGGLVLTASVGVCVGAGSAIDGAELLEAADRALYRAKRQGRDRVVVAGGEVASGPRRGTEPEGPEPG